MLDQLKAAGMQILAPATNTELIDLLIDGESTPSDLPEGTLVCHILPHYRGNAGFFHLFCESSECLLLKSCYGDGVRYLKAAMPLSESILIELSKAALQAEGIAKSPLSLWAAVTPDGAIYIAKATAINIDHILNIDPQIPRPLMAAEYDYNGSAAVDSLMSRSLFNTVLPECLSFMGAALLKQYPDILHPYFLAFEAKVQSPSQQVLSGRAYMNISGVLSAMKEAKTDRKAFAASFMPWQKIFDKDKPVTPELFSIEFIPMEEVLGFVDTLKQQIESAGGYSFLEENYTEPVIHLTMLQMMLYFIFQEQWLYLARLTGCDKADILRWIYKTRANSPFFTGASLDLPLFFDPVLESHKVSIKPAGKPLSTDELIASLPAFTRLRNKKKILSMLAAAQQVLDTRDTVTALAGEYHKKSRGFIMENASYLKDKGRVESLDEVFMVDKKELRRLVHDTYYAGLRQILEYRQSYQSRIAAQPMPYEMYVGDIRHVPRIIEEQLAKFEAQLFYPCSTYNATELEGEAKAYNGDMTGQICCARAFSLPMLAKIGRPAALITDIAPIFSYVTEFALLYDIPLYSGIRYSELLLAGKQVKLTTETVALVGESDPYALI
ncbi:MAG: hypothetical protein LBV04_02235 [Deferribacteraceae bacterium]|jgi:hypothetical protein|nr:hypothetical protein [Deferribacteraceae bacterium]